MRECGQSGEKKGSIVRFFVPVKLEKHISRLTVLTVLPKNNKRKVCIIIIGE